MKIRKAEEKDIPRLLALLEQGLQYIWGSRLRLRQEPSASRKARQRMRQ